MINLGECSIDGVDVAAMAIQPVETLETVARERLRPVEHRGDDGGVTQRDGARKRHVMLGLSDIEGGANENARLVAGAARNDLRAQRVGAEQAVRSVLFRRSDGD